MPNIIKMINIAISNYIVMALVTYEICFQVMEREKHNIEITCQNDRLS